MTQSLEAIARRNIRLFIAFRVLFNGRFYYPVFAIIFLDFGLTIEQFALLNVVWAVTIILAEVPSGALSDLIGRRTLLIITAVLMVSEMLVWAFAPRGNLTVLFWVLAANRVLSGLGEASASGSDEALAYDSLEQAGMKDQWSQVLATMARWQSVAFMCALGIGGAVYDVSVMQWCADRLGIDVTVTRDMNLRWPIYLNLVTAALTLLVTLRFVEPGGDDDENARPSIANAFRQTWAAGRWILATPFAFMVIAAGAFIDSVGRMLITMNSEYYRLIEFTPVYFGFIGMGISGLGFFVAPLAKRLVDDHSPAFNFFVLVAMSLIGFYGASFFFPYVGLVFVVILFVAFSILTFAISYYLNHITTKSIRATVLSFKGMALNLGYGLIGVLYALLGAHLRGYPVLAADKDALFMSSIGWFPGYFAIGSVLVVLLSLIVCPNINRAYTRMNEQIAATDA